MLVSNLKLRDMIYLKNSKLIFWMLLLFSVFIFIFCAERKRLNPLDPQNKETEGKPQGLRVYSELNQVFLSWKPVDVKNILGYRVYRKAAFEDDFQPIYVTPQDSSEYVDKNVQYEIRYTYRITVLGEDFESNPSDTVSIIPGPTSIWFTDLYGRNLIRLTHDCRHEIERIPVDGYPWALAIEKSYQQLWYTDVLFNRVLRVNLNTRQQFIVTNLNYSDPVDVEIDHQHGRVWVADEDSGKVIVFRDDGLKLSEIAGFQRISDIDICDTDGYCWVVDSRTKKVTQIRSDYRIGIDLKDLESPTRIAIDQTTCELWVIDKGSIKKLNRLGKKILTINSGFNYPWNLAVDAETGNCWVLDWGDQSSNSRLICFASDGSRLVEVAGFSYPETIIINPYDHGCIVADSGSGKIIKISETGIILSQSTEYFYPYGLAIIYR